MRLFVGNLPYDIRQKELADLFGVYGEAHVEIPIHPSTGRAMGFAIVSYSTRKEAQRARQELNGLLVAGRLLRVMRSRKPATKSGRRRVGRSSPARR
jgi:RNA recognition motif-containing protein